MVDTGYPYLLNKTNKKLIAFDENENAVLMQNRIFFLCRGSKRSLKEAAGKSVQSLKSNGNLCLHSYRSVCSPKKNIIKQHKTKQTTTERKDQGPYGRVRTGVRFYGTTGPWMLEIALASRKPGQKQMTPSQSMRTRRLFSLLLFYDSRPCKATQT